MSVLFGLNEPKAPTNRRGSVSVPVKGETAFIDISSKVWEEICEGRMAMIKSTVYRDGKRLRLYWNFNCEAPHQLQITNHNGAIEFMENITAVSVSFGVRAPANAQENEKAKSIAHQPPVDALQVPQKRRGLGKRAPGGTKGKK